VIDGLCCTTEVSYTCFVSTNVVGDTAEEKALVNQWMEYRITKIDPCENDARSIQGILKVT